MNHMRIIKELSLGLVIDVQERLFPVIYNKESLERNLTVLIEGLRILKIPVLVTEQYKKGLGETIESINSLLVDAVHSEKIAFSCCDEPSVVEQIEISKKRFVIIAGIESHICVLQTAIDLKERGYIPVVIEDCVGSRKENDKKVAVERMKQEGVIVSTYESVLFELCRYAGSESFKSISKLVK